MMRKQTTSSFGSFALAYLSNVELNMLYLLYSFNQNGMYACAMIHHVIISFILSGQSRTRQSQFSNQVIRLSLSSGTYNACQSCSYSLTLALYIHIEKKKTITSDQNMDEYIVQSIFNKVHFKILHFGHNLLQTKKYYRSKRRPLFLL